MSENWVKTNRELKDHWLWLSEPFTKGQAWMDLIMLARWKDGKSIHRGRLLYRKRGDVCCSLSHLAVRWQWSRNKVKRFMTLLESEGMIVLNGATDDTTITLVNYSKWQGGSDDDGATDEATDGATREATDEATDGAHKKKVKKEKNVNNKYSVAAKEIIDHLNERTGAQYKATTKDTQKHIRARLDEGFTVDDFKSVIDKKSAEWMNTEWQKYLRPQTLFGTKFESYLNAQAEKNKDITATLSGIFNKAHAGTEYNQLEDSQKALVSKEKYNYVKNLDIMARIDKRAEIIAEWKGE